MAVASCLSPWYQDLTDSGAGKLSSRATRNSLTFREDRLQENPVVNIPFQTSFILLMTSDSSTSFLHTQHMVSLEDKCCSFLYITRDTSCRWSRNLNTSSLISGLHFALPATNPTLATEICSDLLALGIPPDRRVNATEFIR